jgi:hypothetical protein
VAALAPAIVAPAAYATDCRRDNRRPGFIEVADGHSGACGRHSHGQRTANPSGCACGHDGLAEDIGWVM